MTKIHLVTAACLVWLSYPAWTEPVAEQAEILFHKGLYQQALDAMEKAVPSATGEASFKLFYRIQETRGLLFRYGEAAQALYDSTPPTENHSKARWLLLRADMGRQYLKQYAHQMPADAQPGVKDISKWTADQWRTRIAGDYLALLPLRESALAQELANENYFVAVQDTDLEKIPTLWDFAVSRWTDYLLNESGDSERPDPRDWIDKPFVSDLSAQAPAAVLAASLWEQASAGGAAARAYARESWKLKRVYPPWTNSVQTADPRVAKWAGLLESVASAMHDPRSQAAARTEAAKLFAQLGQFSQAVSLCKQVIATSPTEQCHGLATEIESPRVELEAFPSAPTDSNRVKVRTRNLEKVYVRLYPTSVKELGARNGRDNNSDWSELRLLNRQAADYFLNEKPTHASELVLHPSKPYDWATTDAGLPPALPPGLYAVLVSDRKDFGSGARLLRGAILNVTDLVLFADRPQLEKRAQNSLSLRVFDGATGEPAPNAGVQIRLGGAKPKVESVRTDLEGAGDYTFAAGPADPLVEKNKSAAYLTSPLWLSLVSGPRQLEIHIDTDRPIYRPGQTVQARVTAFGHSGKNYSAVGKLEVDFTALDANGKPLFKKRLKFNNWGSAAVAFTLPTRGMLGRFSLTAGGRESGTNTLGNGFAEIRVEEYVRPDFEVTLDPPATAWKLGETAGVQGHALYYYGGPVAASTVRYRIWRESYLPLHWYFWRMPPATESRRQISGGEVKTDAKGGFSFSFVPTRSPDGLPGRFTVETTVVGPAGRTLSAERTYVAGPEAFALELRQEAAFHLAGATPQTKVRAVSLENQPVDTSVSLQLERLEIVELLTTDRDFSATGLADKLKAAKASATIQSQTARTLQGAAAVTWPALKAGAYRVSAKSQDSNGSPVLQTSEFLVHGPDLALSAVALTEKPKYRVGETAKILIGSADLRGKQVVEVWQGEHRLKAWLVGGGVQVLPLPIEVAHQGGVILRWYGVYRHALRGGDTKVEVPFDDKKLTLNLQTPARAKPGEKVTWTAELVDENDKPVSGEAMVRVTDRALDAYAASEPPWVHSLYQSSFYTPAVNRSYAPVSFSWLRDNPSRREYTPPPPELPLPTLRFAKAITTYGLGGGMRMMRMAMPQGASWENSVAEKAKVNTSAAPANETPVRSSFEETAFFGPQLELKNGRGQMSFRFSDATTSWKVQGYALDSDLRWATVDTTVSTRQEFFVEARTPRFVRETDTTTLQAITHNDTDKTLVGKLGGNLAFTGELPLRLKTLNFKLAPYSSQTLGWDVQVPKGMGEAKFKVEAQTPAFRDAQSRTFLWLPGRQRQIQSQVASFTATEPAELAVSNLPADAAIESSTLQIDPQIATALFRAIPLLTENRGEDALSVVDRYVPAAIVSKIFEKTPGLAKAMAQAPKRKSRTATWDANDPRRLVALDETPWLTLSEGDGPALWDFADDKAIARLAKQTWTKLAGLQKPSGAFCWFAGGPDDPWVTLRVLGQLAEAKRNGVDIPSTIAAQALPYLKKGFPQWLENDPHSLSFMLYTASVLTLLYEPAEWNDLVTQAIAFAEKSRDSLTALGKVYLADILFRRQQNARAQTYLDLALDGMRENTWGAYWAPEKQSWIWYNDSLDKHALFLRALLDWKPGDARITPMVRWMLFNRKASQWNSPRNAASAVLALLAYQKKQKTLFQNETFNWKWNKRENKLTLGGTDILDKPLTWTTTGADPAASRATVSKTGGNLAFASLSTVFTSQESVASQGGPIELGATYFRRVAGAGGIVTLEPIKDGAGVPAGAEVEAHFTIRAAVPMEYLRLRVPRAAGFESVDRTSEWSWENGAVYHEVRDSQDSYYLPRVPAGEWLIKTRYFATTPGRYRFAQVGLQSMFSPDLTANASSMTLRVTP